MNKAETDWGLLVTSFMREGFYFEAGGFCELREPNARRNNHQGPTSR